jgi:hypothetical protein
MGRGIPETARFEGLKVFTVKVFIYLLKFKKLHFSSSEPNFVVAGNENFDEKRSKSVHAVNTFKRRVNTFERFHERFLREAVKYNIIAEIITIGQPHCPNKRVRLPRYRSQ